MNNDFEALCFAAKTFKAAVVHEDIDAASDIVYSLFEFVQALGAGPSSESLQADAIGRSALVRHVMARLGSGLSYLQGGNTRTATTIANQVCSEIAEWVNQEQLFASYQEYIM